MVEQVVWTERALRERKEILSFWIDHNDSKDYSTKLNSLFKEATQLIKSHPYIGQPTDIDNIRVKIIRDYLMFYEISHENIYILTIWDSRQDPDTMEFRKL